MCDLLVFVSIFGLLVLLQEVSVPGAGASSSVVLVVQAASFLPNPIARRITERLHFFPDDSPIRTEQRYSRQRQPTPSSSTIRAAVSLSTDQKVEGLLPQRDFERLASLDETISALRKQIPSLLSIPLTDESASKVYTRDTRLTVGTDDTLELASGRDELISISNAIVLTLVASSRAGAFFASFGRQPGGKPEMSFSPKVDCRLVLVVDPSNERRFIADETSPLTIHVYWESNLLPEALSSVQQSIPGTTSTIKGISLLTLDETAKVASHELRLIDSNGSFRDPQAVGQSLAAIRQTVKGFQDAPLVQSFLSSGSPESVFKLVREEFIQQQLKEQEDSAVIAPLYVLESKNENATMIGTEKEESSWILADDYGKNKSIVPPVPGSLAWSTYANCHRAAMHFVDFFIPALAEGMFDNPKTTDFESMFASKVSIATLDGSTLLSGSERVYNFFRSLSLLRQRTFGSWTMQRVAVTEWKMVGDQCFCSVEVCYNSTGGNVPGTPSTTISGVDVYSLSSPVNQNAEVAPVPEVVIEEIRQKRLTIGGNSRQQDCIWFMRSVATAVESGRTSTDGSSLWSSLLLRVAERGRVQNGTAELLQQQQRPSMPPRSDSSAVTVYRVMEALLQDCANLVSVTDNPGRLPAIDLMVPNVQLRGYLDEVLILGRNNYKQSVGLIVASFKAALRSGRVVSDRTPRVRVELTPKGNVRCSLALFLKFSPNIPGLAEFMGSEAASLPFKIEVSSEYALCTDTGRILSHRLLESRVNGQLTPGDVVSRWIKQFSGTIEEGDDETETTNWVQTLQEAAKWVQSASSS